MNIQSFLQKLSFAVVLILLAVSHASAVEHDFNGTWKLNDNGSWYTLQMVHKGAEVTGEILDAKGVAVAELEGTADDTHVVFDKTMLNAPEDEKPYRYEGWLTCEDRHMNMAGFSVRESRKVGWYATRVPVGKEKP